MVVDFERFKLSSPKWILNNFYDSLERRNIHLETDDVQRSIFFNQARGLFLKILRKNRNIEVEEISCRINISSLNYKEIENGTHKITDAQFFRICHFLKGSAEASVFLEKVEECFKPDVKKARLEMAHILKNQLGICFADKKKYASQKFGVVIPYDFKN